MRIVAVTAKVRIGSKIKQNDGGDVMVQFYPDYQDGRNKEWAAATPSLSLQMVVRGDVADRFTSGAAYTLTFEEDQ